MTSTLNLSDMAVVVLFIGVIRHVSGGLRYPVIAHMAADLTIALLVIILLLPT